MSQADPRPRIAVTGLGVVTANARDVPEFQRALRAGVSGIRPIEGFETSDYCNRSAGVVADESLRAHEVGRDSQLDRAAQLALIATQEAVADAKLQIDPERGRRGGVALGTSLGGCLTYLKGLRRDHDLDPATEFDGPYPSLWNISPCRIVSEICGRFAVSGPTMSTVTACAAGSNSIALGMDMIRQQRADFVLAVATDPVSELSFSGFNILMAMTADVCRPFDANRTGLVIGEGAGALVLEEYSAAERRGARIYCELAGYGLSNDGYHLTQPDPDAGGACRAIERALADAGADAGEVDYINAHGTATKYNDLTELKAIRQVYGDRAHQLPISSIKSMIGHTLGAAGTIEAVATVLGLYYGFLPPTLNFKAAMDEFPYDFVPQSRPIDGAELMSSHSFGFGGNVACVLFRRAAERQANEQPAGR